MSKMKKMNCITLISASLLTFSAISPSLTVVSASSRRPVQVQQQVTTFSNQDVLIAAESLYNKGTFTKEQYQIVYSAYSQRLGVKGVNKVVNLGNGMMDVYINNVTWSAMIGLGGGAAGLLLGAIPGLNAGVAAMIGTVGGAIGSTYFGADRGVIMRMKQVYIPPTSISGAKVINQVISYREQ